MANEENNFENNEINGLLGSMKRIDAPADFDFRVRARIASGRPAVRPRWLPTFGKAAAMMVLLVAVGGYFGFRSFRTPAVDQASVITVPTLDDRALASKNAVATDRKVIPSVEQTSDPMPVPPPETVTQREPPSNRLVTRTGSNTRGGGSRDIALGSSNVITANTRHLTKDILSSMDIDANDTGSGWTVGEVKQNSRAERSGLKTGDVIESIKGKKVRVRRGGKVVTIPLKP